MWFSSFFKPLNPFSLEYYVAGHYNQIQMELL
jgi:hypothetical protein